jgi:hypothetical protein
VKLKFAQAAADNSEANQSCESNRRQWRYWLVGQNNAVAEMHNSIFVLSEPAASRPRRAPHPAAF